MPKFTIEFADNNGWLDTKDVDADFLPTIGHRIYNKNFGYFSVSKIIHGEQSFDGNWLVTVFAQKD